MKDNFIFAPFVVDTPKVIRCTIFHVDGIHPCAEILVNENDLYNELWGLVMVIKIKNENL